MQNNEKVYLLRFEVALEVRATCEMEAVKIGRDKLAKIELDERPCILKATDITETSE